MANEGHELDNDTVALWRLDETVHADYTTAADETGNYNATQTPGSAMPSIQGGPSGVGDYARWWHAIGSSDNQFLGFTSDTALQDVLKADWTIEAWVYLESNTSQAAFFTVANTADGDATKNYLAHGLIIAGKLSLFWETGTGTNQQVTQVAGSSVPLRTWTYIAITASESGGTRTVNFFIGSGTAQDSGSAPNAVGGSDTFGRIGLDADDTDELNGAISQMRLSDVVRSGTELNDNATDSTFQFANDGNTTLLWKFQEVPAAADLTAAGLHLHPTLYTSTPPRIVDPHVMDGGQARAFVSTGESFTLFKREEIRTLLLGEYTVEWWGQLLDTGVSNRQIIYWTGSTGSESEANNFLVRARFTESAGDYVGDIFLEHDGGVNSGATGTATIVSDNTEGATAAQQRHHYALVIEDAGGGQRNMLVYRDAVLVDTLGPYNAPTGGTTPGVTEGLELFTAWAGEVDDVRLSSIARDQTAITASFNRGVFDGVGDTGTPPVVPGNSPTITNITPNLNTIILPETVIGFDVTDPDGDLYDVTVAAIFTAGGLDEIIHWGFGGTFGQRYLQTSTRVAITNGFRYSVRRVGGWPETPRLRVRALDTKLNELS